MLSISDLTFSYETSIFSKKQPLLNKINLSINSGDFIGIIGANGCGKSTLLSIIAGTKKFKYGMLTFNGYQLLSSPTLYTKNIGYLPQSNPLIPELSVYENLKFWYKGKTSSFQKDILENLPIPEIKSYLKVPIRKLSGGIKRKVALCCALINSPSLLILDEPGSSLDMIGKQEIFSYLKTYSKNGGTILLTTHEEKELVSCTKLFSLQNATLTQINPPFKGELLINKIFYQGEKNE